MILFEIYNFPLILKVNIQNLLKTLVKYANKDLKRKVIFEILNIQ